jgi:hypothetical protein
VDPDGKIRGAAYTALDAYAGFSNYRGALYELPMAVPHFPRKRLLQLLGGLTVFVFWCEGYGASIDHAKITEVVNDVTVLDPRSRTSAPAKANDLFLVPEIMKTGLESRSEMVAEDQTITRVGANTLFSFEPRERTINLRRGSILFQSPTGMGGGAIRTASATASVLGTTIIVVATPDGGFKLLVLEGTGEVRMRNGIHIILHGGQMVVIPPHGHKPGPVLDFLLNREVHTARLVLGFKRPLPTWNKIRKQILEQEQDIAMGTLQAPTVIVENNLDPNTRLNESQALHGGLVLHER